jgi:pyridoxine 5-phosphate synthase
MIPRLGVNIDHVATLRQQRDEGYPSVVDAASCSLRSGADQITIHLREDRRHIQDTDVQSVGMVTKEYSKPLNFEMGCTDEIADIAIVSQPEWVCLVPEKREEKTTEGGLDLITPKNFENVKRIMSKLRDNIPGLKISLFVEASVEVMNKSIELKADAVEIHTGHYANAFLEETDIQVHLNTFQECYDIIKKSELTYHAGHGLTLDSVVPLLKLKIFEEYNIGHWIIGQSVFEGLPVVIDKFVKLFKQHPLDQ